MKNKILIIIMALFILIGLYSCKRNSAELPGPSGPAGFRIALSGVASPSTLYLDSDKKEPVETIITFLAKYNNGSPCNNASVILEAGDLGYFEGRKSSVTRSTSSSGEVSVRYIIPGSLDLSSEAKIYIKATLQDNGRLDSSLGYVYDFVLIKIIPSINVPSDVVKVSGSITDASGAPLSGVSIMASNSGGSDWTASKGIWSINVPTGWYGVITPVLDGYTFQPSSITVTQDRPLTYNKSNCNFVGKPK